MISVSTSLDSTGVLIAGHGLIVEAPFPLGDGVTVLPTTPEADLERVAAASPRFEDYASVVSGREMATFSIRISGCSDARQLAVRSWNALWVFHLLSLAAGAPCMPLFSVTDGASPSYSLVNRSPFLPTVETVKTVGADRLAWARNHQLAFNALVNEPHFNTAMLCYGNAHYLPDLPVRIMLLWSGIEGLLSVDGELNRRLALYAALLIDGSSEDKAVYFTKVKKAYGLRSKAVHGARLTRDKLVEGYATASTILIELLARCVELGRVPKPDEFDRAAVTGTLPIVTP